MKIRSQFVSNSSSASFCICKNFMTEEQIKQFCRFIDEYNDSDRSDGSICENEYYFAGEVDVNDDDIDDFLVSIGVDPKYIFTAC